MDAQQFDSLTRKIAGGGSRRRLLRGMIGAAALGMFRRGAAEVSAHHGSSGPGDPCRKDSQCLGADAPLVCAWNGVGHDGSLNCCTYEGSRCGFDAACCGYAVCIDGFCATVTAPSGSGCTGAGCGCVPGWFGDDPCDDGLVCCQGASGALMCLPLYTCSS